jgi:predicted amidophosphoribosyltransferase
VALERASSGIDLDSEQASCPACGESFSTAAARCPSCGLRFR